MTDMRADAPNALLAQGHAAYHALRLDEAMASYEAALAARPDDYDACLGLARTLTRRRDQEGARAYAERCVSLAPERYEGYAALGALDFLTDRFDAAETALREAIERAPDEPEPHLTLAQVYADLRRFDEAHAALERGREALGGIGDDAYRRQMEAFAFHVQTYLYLAEGKEAEARESAQEVIAREADNPHAACLANSNLGILEARRRHYDAAIEYLERAFEMNPYFYRAGGALGRILLVRNRNERAAQVLRRVLEAGPAESASTRYAYALALGRLKQRDEARRQFRQAIDEGLKGADLLMARWQLIWQSTLGRQVLIGLVLLAVLLWVVLGNPSPTALTFVALLVVILVLQRTVGRRGR